MFEPDPTCAPGEHLAGPPAAIVVFGASGDLTRRKLIPALYALDCQGLLDDATTILGLSRSEWSDDDFRREMRAGVDRAQPSGPRGASDLGALRRPTRLRRRGLRGRRWLRGDSSGGSTAVGEPTETGSSTCQPPRASSPGSRRRSANPAFAAAALPAWWWRSPSARTWRAPASCTPGLAPVFPEDDIFRIDHYLGKETVQNLFVVRFANAIFEPSVESALRRPRSDHRARDLGVGGRGGYYDDSGALRDMLQNHLLQVLSLVAMEPPTTFAAAGDPDEKVKVAAGDRPCSTGDAIRERRRARPLRRRRAARRPISPRGRAARLAAPRPSWP